MVQYCFFQRFYDDIDLVLEVFLQDKLYLRWETRIASEFQICFCTILRLMLWNV